MSYIDFAALKERIRIEQVVSMLGLTMRQKGDQWRGECPTCKNGGPRALAVNTTKQSYFCFSQGKGGDLIALCAHIRAVDAKEAAQTIDGHFGGQTSPTTQNKAASATVPDRSPQPQEPRALRPLDYLAQEHELVQALGVSRETCEAFGAGYAPKGIMRGRLAIPVHSRDGVLLAYCGRAVKGESPALIFPNGFRPESIIFAAERVKEGPLYLVRDPLQVLTAFEAGMENVVAFLTETISAEQLQYLAVLMDESRCEGVELY